MTVTKIHSSHVMANVETHRTFCIYCGAVESLHPQAELSFPCIGRERVQLQKLHDIACETFAEWRK